MNVVREKHIAIYGAQRRVLPVNRKMEDETQSLFLSFVIHPLPAVTPDYTQTIIVRLMKVVKFISNVMFWVHQRHFARTKVTMTSYDCVYIYMEKFC